ncbi:MAG: CehA/McbA family metallohydrolase [Myxococcales bacterium]|nr:CehA/McbA family metallohydrolase [Myxococcales bacterium]
MPPKMLRIAVAAAAAVSMSLLSGCTREGCLAGEPNCRVAPPCRKVKMSCDSDALEVRVLASAAERPGGSNALGAKGDVRIANRQVEAVIAGIGNQNYIDPNGGSILDLANPGKGNDGINQILQVVGILPRDAANYTSLELIDERPERVGVQLSGTLDGQPDRLVYTLYELRPCDVGVRVRTEALNAGTDPQLWALVDGYYWSKREPLPFAPGEGSGFAHKSFNLLTINEVFRRFPYMAASSHAAPYASYAEVSCTDPYLEGFHSETVSAVGLGRTVVQPRDYQIFERYIVATADDDAAGATDLALEVRAQALGEKYVTLSGRIERAGALSLGTEREVSVLISEGRLPDSAALRIPWTQVVPDAAGKFRARVPAGNAYVVEVHSFGQKAAEKEIPKAVEDQDLGAFVLPSTARVTFSVIDEQTSQDVDAEVFVVPADEETRQATAGTFHGQFGTCSPWLGPPPGSSPACNRVLVRKGLPSTVEIPVGRFHFYAFRGPFWTLQRKTEALTPTNRAMSFALRKLPLQPQGTVSADMHVHGGASFDSQIPDYDRVLSFSASELEVIVATDHDVVYDFGQLVRQLGLQDSMTTVIGVETTGHIPFMYIPNYAFPLVIGHYNLWPLKYDPSAPRNGGPFDELVEPGELFDLSKDLFTATPLIELNHPWADPEFGRDLGFPRALGLNTLEDLPQSDNGTAAGMYVRAPKGGSRNDAHHAQEVMNGSQNDALLPYRAFWFFTLNQGQLKTGTANSDSHSLTDNTVGMPRNLVYANTRAGPSFDVDRFNQAVIAGQVMGTNGPIIESTIEDASGAQRSFGFAPFKPKADAAISIKVSAAPWVPVDEVRFVVNGKVVETMAGQALKSPSDPFGTQGLERVNGTVKLSALVSGTKDAWLVIEAGTKLPLAKDYGGLIAGGPDGIPDTSDNNGDGLVDCKDVQTGDKDKDGDVDCADHALGAYGPLKNAPPTRDEANPLFHYAAITEGYPMAFTNPFILDMDGNGKFDAPGAGGAR